MQALKVQRDAHDFVGASFHKWRNLDVVSPRELLADAAREIEPERSLPLGDVLKELDDAEAIDEVSVDHRAVDCKVAREGTEGKGLLSPLQPWHSAQFHLFLGKQFEHPRTDQVLAGNLCVATARSM
jgi:hypothetical protein